MQPETRRVGAARMRRLLQAEQDTLKPWHESGRQPRSVFPLVQRPQSLPRLRPWSFRADY